MNHRSGWILFTLPTLLLLLAIVNTGCSPTYFPHKYPEPQKKTTPSLPPHEEWVFRHKIIVAHPHLPQFPRLDGLMELSRSPDTVHLVGLGPMGLTLFNLTITPHDVQTLFLHPSLARIPHFPEHVAACVRSIWFSPTYPAPENRNNQGSNDQKSSAFWPPLVYTAPGNAYTVSIHTLNAERIAP